jgi:ATPase subunit of ABC transporter with duplicated ATPase domains
MISLSSVGKSYGDRTLFEDVTVRLDAGNRYGLVGANGSGKTTLLNILAGDDSLSEGEITMASGTRVGVLRQDRYQSDEQLILDVAMMGDEPVWNALSDKERLLAAEHPDAAAIAAVEERIAHNDGYTLESRAAEILEGLGIPEETHREPLSTLSGGFKLRVLLAQTLIGRPELLLLDEPTNHLDILTIRWLEQFLQRYEGCVLVISHDHRFLDTVATHILDVDYETITLYHGNYSAFTEEKKVTRERKEAEIERQQQLIADKKAFVERFRYKASKARQAQSRLKQIDKIDIEELPQTSRRAPYFKFEQQRKSGREVVSVDGVSKSYDDNRVLTDVSLTVRRGERVAIIGANGIGKSTLLRILVGALEPDTGEVTWGYETSVGYFAQDHRELLGERAMTVLDYLWDVCPQETTSFVRGQLGRMLFSGEDVEKKTTTLSGGEAARLIFSRIIVKQPNVLVLDEPTNHLDLESIEALADAVDAFEGTVIFVSHDRWLVGRLGTRIIELTRDGMNDYPGTFEEYLAHQGADHLDAEAALARAREEKKEAEDESTEPSDWAEHKRRRSRFNKLQTQRDEVTVAIEAAEARVAAIQQAYCEPGFFDETPPDEVAALEKEESELRPRIEALMADWERIELELEELAD